MISYDYKKFDKKITKLLENLTIKQNNKLKYQIFEQEAIFLLLKGKKQDSYQLFIKLSNPLNVEIPTRIRNNAKTMVKYHEWKKSTSDG